MTTNQKDLGIKELFLEGLISGNTVRACRNNGIYFLSEVIEQSVDDPKFKSLTKCGMKSRQELIQLCLKYSGITLSYNNKRLRYGVSTELSLLSDDQETKLENYFYDQMQGMSTRSKNVFKRIMGYTDLHSLAYIIDKHENFTQYQNAGQKVESEFIHLKLEMIKYINALHSRGED